MRMHIEMDPAVIREVDELVGPRGRSRFVRDAVLAEVDRRRRVKLIRRSFGAIPDTGHEWDADPALWVRQQRRADTGRIG